MKKVLVVHAHPEQKSFCSSLKNTAISHLTSLGNEVCESDLYAMKFNPVGNQRDFKSLDNQAYFKYQMEQVHAYKNNLFADDLKVEMQKLEWCDVLIFNFPLWWFGMPAILKGWVDRVFAMGFAYGAGKGIYENGTYKEKTAFITMTTGGPKSNDEKEDREFYDTILFQIQNGIFYFTGMTVLPPFISYGPARATQQERENDLSRYRSYLENLDAHKPIYTNRSLL